MRDGLSAAQEAIVESYEKGHRKRPTGTRQDEPDNERVEATSGPLPTLDHRLQRTPRTISL